LKKLLNPAGEDNLFKSIGDFFKDKLSVNASLSRDVDYRKLTFLNCIRKLFEEARAADCRDINGDSEIFKEMPKNYDGTIKKDDFIYALLNTKIFSLTRTDIANISALLLAPSLNPKQPESNSIDLEDL
jgi:hypothetical protein